MVENSNIYKTMRNKTQEEYITKYSIVDFFKYKILIVQEHIFVDEECYLIKQFISSLVNSHRNYYILFMHHELYFQLCTITLNFQCVPLLFIDRT